MRFIVLTLGVAATAGLAVLAAPPQDRQGGTDRPVMPTQARVLIENRRADEAVPVVLVQRPDVPPLRVELGGNPVTAIPTRRVAAAWEYRSVVVPATTSAAAALDPMGREGWEVTGVQFAAPNGAVLLLKRPR